MDFDSLPNDAAPQAASASSQGQPSFDSLQDDSQQYSTPDQQAKAGLEGLTRGIAGPIASAIEKNYYHVPAEDIRGRQEANPITAGVGEGAGLVGGALTGTGEAAALEAVGKAFSPLAAPATYAAKVGSSIVKNAAEMAAYQSADEAGKVVLQDPKAGAESAISNIGLAAALGGAGGGLISGAISPLWDAVAGSKATQGLKALVSKIGGIEGDVGGNTAMDLSQRAGVEIPPEIQSVINDQPMAREGHSILSQDDSSLAGRSYQKTLGKLDEQLGTKVAESLGKTPQDIMSVPEKNAYETGQNIGNTLHNELKAQIDPINDAYDKVTEKFKNAEVSENAVRQMADELSQKSISEGWHKSFDEANSKLINNITSKLPEQSTINDLKNAISNLYRPFDAPDMKAAIEAKKILSKGLETAVTERMGPDELNGYNTLRKQYSVLSDHLEDLDTHLHLGKWNGPKTFLSALKDKADSKGEQLLSNLTNKNNAGLLQALKDKPETLSAISNHYKDTLIRSATKNLNPGELIKANKLVKDISELSPQQKALIATPEQHKSIEAVNAITDSLKDPNHNFSNTARTLRKHAANAISPISMISALTGHSEAGILSYLGSLGMNEAVPGMRLAMLKMLGSNAPVDAIGLKASAEYFNAALKGAKTLSRATENVFKPGSQVLMSSQVPSEKALMHLDKMVASNDPKETNRQMSSMTNSKVGHYSPDHGTALAQTSAQSLQYLKALRPTPQIISPLDKTIPPSPMQEARYQRALTIAQQPVIVLQHVKDGTLQATDIQDLNGMYPALYQQLSQKMTSQLASAQANKEPIPYKTRMGVSLFLGQPMDSTMQPNAIMAAQRALTPQPPAQPQGKPKKPSEKASGALNKGSKAYQTSTQAAESDRAGRD